MPEPEFTATGVRIGRWLRSLTSAGQVRIRDGRLTLLTSYGREIDSAPVDLVRAGKRWFATDDSAMATVNGTRYVLKLPEPARFLDAVRAARGRGGSRAARS